jgi:hypothetical protein
MEQPLRILPSETQDPPPGVLDRIALELKRIADRLEDDAAVFNEMVAKGKGLSA